MLDMDTSTCESARACCLEDHLRHVEGIAHQQIAEYSLDEARRNMTVVKNAWMI